MALKKLNEDIRRAKKTKARAKAKPAAPPPPPAVDYGPLVAAIERSKQPIVNIEQREPVGYNVQVDLNRKGDIVAAKILPIKG